MVTSGSYKRAIEMLKLIIKYLLIPTVVIGVGVMLLAQWKVKNELNDFSQIVRPFMDFSYHSTSINYDGEIKIDGVSILFGDDGTRIDVREVKFFIGNFYQLATLKSQFKKRKLPESAHLILKGVSLPLDSKMIAEMNENTPASGFDIIDAAYCGRVERLGVDEYRKMGYSEIYFSTDLFYSAEQRTGIIALKGTIDVENTKQIEYEMKVGGVLSWIEEFDITMMGGEGFITPDLISIEVTTRDTGYNQRKAEFCQGQQDSKIDYYTGHTDQAIEMAEYAGVTITDDFKKLYFEAIQPGSEINFIMKPKVSFDFDRVEHYDYQYIIEEGGIKIRINNTNLPLNFEGVKAANIEKIVKQSKKHQKIKSDLNENYQLAAQTYQTIEPSKIDQYKGYRSKIKRKDGKFYKGRLSRFSETTVWTVVRQNAGEITIPIKRKDIERIEILK